MKISAVHARRFSECLLRLYACNTEGELTATVDGFEPGEPGEWLAGLLREHAEHRRTQLQGGLPGKLPDLPQLTRRECEVLQRIALGETDAAIGRALEISPKTASKHVENILRKLGVETRTAAAVQAPRREP